MSTEPACGCLHDCSFTCPCRANKLQKELGLRGASLNAATRPAIRGACARDSGDKIRVSVIDVMTYKCITKREVVQRGECDGNHYKRKYSAGPNHKSHQKITSSSLLLSRFDDPSVDSSSGGIYASRVAASASLAAVSRFFFPCTFFSLEIEK